MCRHCSCCVGAQLASLACEVVFLSLHVPHVFLRVPHVFLHVPRAFFFLLFKALNAVAWLQLLSGSADVSILEGPGTMGQRPAGSQCYHFFLSFLNDCDCYISTAVYIKVRVSFSERNPGHNL